VARRDTVPAWVTGEGPDGQTALPWVTLVLLGGFHGANPAMGWMFAVSNGLQAGSRRAVLRSLPPIGLGHLASVGATGAALVVVGRSLPLRTITIAVGVALVGFGVWRLFRHNHAPRVGMRLGWRGLFVWSFAVSTACGAGLMLAPVLLHNPVTGTSGFAYFCHLTLGSLRPSLTSGLGAAAVHAGATIAVQGALALVMYQFVGLAALPRAWINLDKVSAFVLVGAGLLVVV
jgi:hypothetical protein